MSIRSLFSSQLLRSCSLAACTALVLLACEREHVSVGTLPCSDDERVLCEPHAREVAVPYVPHCSADHEQPATIVWQHELPECGGLPCDDQSNAYLVHEDGEVTLAAVRSHDAGRELWVAWLDVDGQFVFETRIPGSSAWLRSDRITQLALQHDADGKVLLLAGRDRALDDDAGGTLRAYAVERSGETAIRFEVDTGADWPPGKASLLDSGVLISRGELAARAPDGAENVELASYRRGGDMRWHQTQIARVPDRQELGLSFADDTVTELRGLAVDRRGRIWGSLMEGVPGLVQLDPDGLVHWHALVANVGELFERYPMPIAIDSRDRPIIGVLETVLRFEPDGTDEERLAPHGCSGQQEQYWPQTVQGLDVDAQDRIYVATHDGPLSLRRRLVERISEDLTERERFVLPMPGEDDTAQEFQGLQVAANGDVYVRSVGETEEPLGPDRRALHSVTRIARVRLGE